MILCKCPNCGKAYKVKDEMNGRSAKCPCGTRFVIRNPDDAPAPEAPIAAEPVAQPAPEVAQVPAPQEPMAPAAQPEPAKPAEQVVPSVPQVSEPTMAAPTAPAVTPQPVFQAVKVPQMGSVSQASPAAPGAFQPAKAPGFAPAKAAPVFKPKTPVDEGYGGIGRLLFIAILVGSLLLELFLLYISKNSGSMLKHGLAGVWGLVCIAGLLVITQMRLVNIGSNEYLAFIWPIMTGWCALCPEGFADAARKPQPEPAEGQPEPKKPSKTGLLIGSILIPIIFYAIVARIAYWIWFHA